MRRCRFSTACRVRVGSARAPSACLRTGRWRIFAATGARAPPESTLVWVDRQGGEEPLAGPVDAHAELNLSPDGTQVAVAVESSVNRDLWVYDLARGARERLTLDPAVDSTPVWSPDGERVAFLSQRERGHPRRSPDRLHAQAAHDPQRHAAYQHSLA